VADIQSTIQRSGMRIYPRNEPNQDTLNILRGNEEAEDEYFRSHWEKTYTGGTYQEYDPAYRYGESMAGNPGYKAQGEVAELRVTWQERHPQSAGTSSRKRCGMGGSATTQGTARRDAGIV
jgi:hypothetical protein